MKLACLAVGRPKESCDGAIDEWQESNSVLPLHLRDKRRKVF